MYIKVHTGHLYTPHVEVLFVKKYLLYFRVYNIYNVL